LPIFSPRGEFFGELLDDRRHQARVNAARLYEHLNFWHRHTRSWGLDLVCESRSVNAETQEPTREHYPLHQPHGLSPAGVASVASATGVVPLAVQNE
jgi:hypothetical protein